jgi:FixJ family two-component response regulator
MVNRHFRGTIPKYSSELYRGLVAGSACLRYNSSVMKTLAPLVAILDDEPEMLKAIRRLLASRGFRVDTYERGADLLTALAGSARPDCLLLDLHMPQMSGFDVLEAMRTGQILVPVIVITGHDAPGMEERARMLGAVGYLKKPVDRDDLLSAIDAGRSSAGSG